MILLLINFFDNLSISSIVLSEELSSPNKYSLNWFPSLISFSNVLILFSSFLHGIINETFKSLLLVKFWSFFFKIVIFENFVCKGY